MGLESPGHRRTRKLLANLGKKLGFIVELPDEKECHYKSPLHRKRPDVIWRFNLPKNLATKRLYLDQPYAIFEAESCEQWGDIKRHLDNILHTSLIPCKFFASFYDGEINENKKEILRGYASKLDIPLHLIFLFPSELERFKSDLFRKGELIRTEEVMSFLNIIRTLHKLVQSKLYVKILNALNKREQIIFSVIELNKGEAKALKNTRIGQLILVKNHLQQTSGYIIKLSPKGKEVIEGLSILHNLKNGIYFQRFFPEMRKILESPSLGKMRVSGVNAYFEFIVKSFKDLLDSNILNREDISCFIDFLQRRHSWQDIFLRFLAI